MPYESTAAVRDRHRASRAASDLRYISAIVYLLTTLVIRLVSATAFLEPSGSRVNRHSWRPPRWTRSALLMRPDVGAGTHRRAIRREIQDHRPPPRQACEACQATGPWSMTSSVPIGPEA